jgi:hypothetical protein
MGDTTRSLSGSEVSGQAKTLLAMGKGDAELALGTGGQLSVMVAGSCSDVAWLFGYLSLQAYLRVLPNPGHKPHS